MGMCALGNLPNMMNTLDMFLTPLCQGGAGHQGTGLLSSLSQCSYNVKFAQNRYMLAFSLKQKLAGLTFIVQINIV